MSIFSKISGFISNISTKIDSIGDKVTDPIDTVSNTIHGTVGDVTNVLDGLSEAFVYDGNKTNDNSFLVPVLIAGVVILLIKN